MRRAARSWGRLQRWQRPPYLSGADLAAGLTVRRASTRTEVRRDTVADLRAERVRAAILGRLGWQRFSGE